MGPLFLASLWPKGWRPPSAWHAQLKNHLHQTDPSETLGGPKDNGKREEENVLKLI